MIRFGLPLSPLLDEPDELSKSFTSGPKATHKYWRRVRVLTGGKLGWRYYYNTPEDRKRFAEDRKKKKHRGKHEDLSHLSDEQIEALHVTRDEWHRHFEETRVGRVPLRDLNADSIFNKVGMSPPQVSFDSKARAMADDYLSSVDEPADLWASAIHPMRALETAVSLLPEEIRRRHPDALKSVRFFGDKAAGSKWTVENTDYKRPGRKSAAWALPKLGTIVLPMDKTGMLKDRPWAANDYTIRGGQYPISVILHEMGHIFEHQMKQGAWQKKNPSAPNWDDWEALGKARFKGRGKEAGITKYAEKNLSERFCETFAAAILTPVQLAESCPAAYDFMHKMMPSKVPPRQEAIDYAMREGTFRGFVDPWWEESQEAETHVKSELLESTRSYRPKVNFHRADPPDPNKIGPQNGGKSDRFYEMSYRGRKLFFRYGMENRDDYDKDGNLGTKWQPSTEAKQGVQSFAKVSQLKEVYDENGNQLPPEMGYLHLIQDVLDNDTVFAEVEPPDPKNKRRKLKKKKITMAYVVENGGFGSDDPYIKALFDPSGGRLMFQKVLRSFGKAGITKDLKALAKLHDNQRGLSPSSAEFKELQGEIDTIMSRLETDADLSGHTKRKAGTSMLPTPVSMSPHEITHTDFRQRSGTFNYDNFEIEGQEWVDRINKVKAGSLEEMEILDEMKAKFPGMLELKMRRWPKGATQVIDGKTVKVGGRFREGAPFVVKDPVTGKRVPALRKITYVMDNPDGTQTRIPTVKGSDGRYRIKNLMWNKLLTPNNEEVRSVRDLEKLCRIAAVNKHRGWISVRSDIPRKRDSRGRWTLDGKGQMRRHLHMEVMFDGKGPPVILGEAWRKKLGSDNPRVDMLLEDDPLGGKLKWAKGRRIIPAEQISMTSPEKKSGPPTEIGDRVVFTTRTLDWKGTTDRGGRKVVARLVKYIPASKAGEAVQEPGWDRMPEGVPDLTLENPPGLAGRLTSRMKDLIKRGILPPWFTYTPKQREWYLNSFTPAHKEWQDTYEELKKQDLDAVYVFAGEINMGGGSKTFRRVGDDVMSSIEYAEEAPVPEPLQDELLAYVHTFIDPRTGQTMGTAEQRLLLPKDQRVASSALLAIENIPGVSVRKREEPQPDGSVQTVIDHITFSLESWPAIRERLRSVSHTDEIASLLAQRVAMLKAAEAQRKAEGHELEVEQITPEWFVDNWLAGLNKTLPNGATFRLGAHQQRGLQKLFDNDLRVLLAHFMGTGKTVTALTACKAAMARPMRKGVPPGEGIPKDLVGDDRAQWLAEHPFVPGTLDPRNPKRCLVVAPLNTTEQWRQSASDFDEGAIVVGAGANDIPIDDFVAGIKDGSIDTDLVVVGPQYFTQHAAKLKECGFDGLVIDEVHQGIKNEQAERNKVVNEWNDDMKMLCLLTGTPMTTSPADFVEYVRLLSKGEQWAGMTKKLFTEEYLEKTDLPKEMGVDAPAPKIRVKPEKLDEFAAILAQHIDIALPKHVTGKVLPAVYIDASETAHMTGAQMAAYNFYLGVLNKFAGGAGLSEDEIGQLSGDAKRSAINAKGVMNCIGFKPGGDEPDAMVTVETVGRDGSVTTGKRIFYAPDPKLLFSKKQRGKNAGSWPRIEELDGGREGALILDQYAHEVLGLPYSEIAGKPIGFGVVVPGVKDPYKIPPTKKQVAEATRRMKDAGWEGGTTKFSNSDAGHIGLRFRGRSIAWDTALQKKIDAARKRGDDNAVKAAQAELQARGRRIAQAREVQRAYRTALQYGIGDITPKELKRIPPEEILAIVAEDHEISFSEAQDLLAVSPDQGEIERSVTYKSDFGRVTITTDDEFVSDPTGSLHLLYRSEDVGEDGKPLVGGKPFEKISTGEVVSVDPKAAAKAVDADGKKASVKKPSMPKGLTPDQKADWRKGVENWSPPPFRLTDQRDEKGRVGVIRDDTGEVVFVPQAAVSSIVASLMDPGRREDRFKADMMMIEGNAKADAVGRTVEQFHDGSGPGVDGERQMVLFAADILTGCRVLEAKLRSMGYRDVNEVIEGSPLHDPTDPSTKGGVGPNRKYFVTYIGSTYTGDREQNCLIFKKVKDELGRDSKTSLFVDMNLSPKPATTVKMPGGSVAVDWMAYRGDVGVDHMPDGVERIQMSQFSSAQRETARRTLGINPPESFVTRMNGKVAEQAYFYGATIPPKMKKSLLEKFSEKDEKGRYKDKLVRSEDILSLISRVPDPTKQTDPEKAALFAKKIAALKAAYSEIAAANATTDPPLTGTQIEVFNNCDFVVASDAAQVGINWGNSSEMVMYDSLGSPMAEWQRMTRCARLLPDAVSSKLFGEPEMVPVMVPKRYGKNHPDAGQVVMRGNDPVMVKKMIDELDDDGKPTGKQIVATVQKKDELGRFVYKDGGIVDKIRAAEPELFQTQDRTAPQATIRGMRFVDDKIRTVGGLYSDDVDALSKKRQSANSALELIAAQCDRMITATSGREQRAWEAIKNQALTARNQGGQAARNQLLAFKETKAPGSNDNLISFPATGLPPIDPMAGTYVRVDTKSAEAAVRKAINQLDEDERQEIMDAGFKTEPPHPPAPDAAALYVAMRAQEILTWVDTMTPVIGEEMQAQAGGATVTDEEIQNRVIEMLSPQDRAVLKERKYLVNVKRIKASGAVGQATKVRQVVYDHELEREKTVTVLVDTGYENEYPVRTEVRTASLGKARTVSSEQIMRRVMEGTDYIAPVEFDSIKASDLTSAAELAKSLRLVFSLGQAFNPLDLVRS